MTDSQSLAIPRSFWREVPCGHPPDPMAARTDDGFVCHCGWRIDPGEVMVPAMDGHPPLAPCDKCGCMVGLP